MQQLQHVKGRFFHELRGQPIHLQTCEVTPIGRVTEVAGPGGGILVCRPLAIEVRQGDLTRRLPVPDATRRSIMLLVSGLLGIALAWSGLRWFIVKRGAA